jgi:hypothetical protein
VEQDIERRKKDTEILKVQRKRLSAGGAKTAAATTTTSTAAGKKKRQQQQQQSQTNALTANATDGLTVEAVDEKLRSMLAGLVQMEKDKIYLADAVKYNVEAKLVCDSGKYPKGLEC